METINIWWEGPFNHQDIIEDKIDQNQYANQATHIGLYQVYSSHPLYGTEVLVYIGLTTGKNGFKNRLNNRWVIQSGNDTENVKIYIGRIYSHAKTIDKTEEIDKIHKAEALLINALKPAYNSSYIQSVKKEFMDADFIINNMNNYRSLFPQLSSKYFWHDEGINFQIIENLSTHSIASDLENTGDYYGFFLKKNDNIWFGVDYDYWNNHNVPLAIYILKNTIKKTLLRKEFKDFDQDDEYYIIPINEDLEDNEISNHIKYKIERLIEITKA